MKRQAMAEWRGDLKTGKGSPTTESGVLDKTSDSFTTRFGASYIGHEFFAMYSIRTHSDNSFWQSCGKVGLSTSANCKAEHLNATIPSLSRASYSWKKYPAFLNR